MHSYVFDVVVTRPATPAGYPAQWADDPRGADHEMDPEALSPAGPGSARAPRHRGGTLRRDRMRPSVTSTGIGGTSS